MDVTSGSHSPTPASVSSMSSMSPSIASSLASSIAVSKLAGQHSPRTSLHELQIQMARAFEGAFQADMIKDGKRYE